MKSRPPGNFRDNPILLREWRRFARAWWGWLLLILIGWFPLALVSRLAWDHNLLPTTFWQETILLILSVGLRPDVLLGFFLVYRMSTEKHWRAIKHELAATRLTPKQIMYGKAFVPIIVLIMLNILSGIYFYGRLIDDPEFLLAIPTGEEEVTFDSVVDRNFITFRNEEEMDDFLGLDDDTVSTTMVSILTPQNAANASSRKEIIFPLAIPIGLLALIEDFFFATVVIMIAMREYFFRDNSLLATFGALLRITLVGVLLFLSSILQIPIVELMPYAWQDTLFFTPPLYTAFVNTIWFALSLPIELIIIMIMIRSLNAQFSRWLKEED